MYLISLWLAAYYNWWLNRVSKRPLLWQVGLGVGAVLLLWLVSSYGTPHLYLIIWLISAVTVVPGFFAAAKTHAQRAIQLKQQNTQLHKIQKLIARGNRNKRP